MFGNLNGWHLLILLAVILLLFGAAKLPALAKSVGQSARVFKGEMKAMKDEDAAAGTTSAEPGVAGTTPGATPSSAPSTAPPATGDSASDHRP
ncbi:Sec-independent protein translocase subunit TatA [Microbacterium sp. ARD31]|jgi:sec-independent protein translocase protein TatA|uniref:Sec-independent protein translocase subunit TatA n=1 Tax=unclassified Microbacterium TaxID=2609290 RepID=UPI00203F0CF9|nr:MULTISPECIES: Sec-independent protein translocase subunit TatA [unclassified Microbacterium]MDT0181270.1 Sec-independent protein translocase subunit TatA [Microbacterium sp. ARD31]